MKNIFDEILSHKAYPTVLYNAGLIKIRGNHKE